MGPSCFILRQLRPIVGQLCPIGVTFRCKLFVDCQSSRHRKRLILLGLRFGTSFGTVRAIGTVRRLVPMGTNGSNDPGKEVNLMSQRIHNICQLETSIPVSAIHVTDDGFELWSVLSYGRATKTVQLRYGRTVKALALSELQRRESSGYWIPVFRTDTPATITRAVQTALKRREDTRAKLRGRSSFTLRQLSIDPSSI